MALIGSYFQFESHLLRQLVQILCFPGRIRSQASPEAVAISNLSFGLSTGKTALLFSEGPISLRTSGLHSFGTVLEIRSFRVTYERQRKVVWLFLSDGREPPFEVTLAGSAMCTIAGFLSECEPTEIRNVQPIVVMFDGVSRTANSRIVVLGGI